MTHESFSPLSNFSPRRLQIAKDVCSLHSSIVCDFFNYHLSTVPEMGRSCCVFQVEIRLGIFFLFDLCNTMTLSSSSGSQLFFKRPKTV